MSEIDSIVEITELYKSAVFEKDVEKFLSLYEPSSRVFDTWNLWLLDSRDARRPLIEDWFGSLGDERVLVDFSDVKISRSEALACLEAIGTYAAITSDNIELRSMQNRFTWMLILRDGVWKIMHEHTSVPIADDLTARLKRD